MVDRQGVVVVGGELVERGRRSEGSLTIEHGRISEVSHVSSSRSDRLEVNAEGLLVSPGLIDLQINGGHGIDLASEPERLWNLARRLPAYGVTSFQPTIVSSPPAIYQRALAAFAERPQSHGGAEPLGLHFEGPMLNPSRAGAHNPDHLRTPSLDLVADWSPAGGVTMVTIAPELPGALEVIGHLQSAGVVVSGGHSTATTDQASDALDAGMTMVTHLFNAMDPMHHREPNLAGFALAERELTAGIIADGIHVDPVLVAVAWAAKGMSRLVLVSDAVAAHGLGPGRHRLGDREVIADETTVRTGDGVLAGASLSLDAAVRNLIAFTGCGAEKALGAATATPAAILNRSDLGVLMPGAWADLALFDDELQVALTLCKGQVSYVADAHRDRITAELVDN